MFDLSFREWALLAMLLTISACGLLLFDDRYDHEVQVEVVKDDE
jgi:hypothetical protein